MRKVQNKSNTDEIILKIILLGFTCIILFYVFFGFKRKTKLLTKTEFENLEYTLFLKENKIETSKEISEDFEKYRRTYYDR